MRLTSFRCPVALGVIAICLLAPISAQSDGVLPVESSISLDPLVGLLGCLRDDKPGYCFQKRALRYFESWMTSSENEDDDGLDGEGGEALPSGITPQWGKIMDQMAERISDSYGNNDDDESDDAKSDDTDLQRRDGSDIEDSRGHKKKKIKAIKKALIKLVLIALLIKSKLKILLVAFQTFLGFKAAVLITVLVVAHAIKLWAEIKHHQHPQKVIYYENAHHQHHYDHHDHDDHHGWNLWGRKGEEASTSAPSGPLSFLSPFLSRRTDDGTDMAYNAYRPKYDPSYDQSYDPYYNTHPYKGAENAPAPSYRSIDVELKKPQVSQ